ncbi:hypothetical protein DNTS_030347 [Danionella cerebrum]|uniref:Nucleolar protein 4 n=1 Tax=Danionella cerebrum TaxID=2873325 RepID=A0A553QIW9_9TELE|nr:hypothetical protein DNTS_030347 [Danionella translucida]
MRDTKTQHNASCAVNPVLRLEGSAHLNLTGGERFQVEHRLTEAERISAPQYRTLLGAKLPQQETRDRHLFVILRDRGSGSVNRRTDKAMSTKKRLELTRRSRSPAASEAEALGDFQEWCLRTYGDSGKTKTVTRRKYNKILQTLQQSDDAESACIENNHINAKFKFWVKSKGFQVGKSDDGAERNGAMDRPVLYVPIKATGSGAQKKKPVVLWNQSA